MKRVLFEALAATFMTLGAVGVLITLGSTKNLFDKLVLHGPTMNRHTVDALISTTIGFLSAACILGIAFYFNGLAGRLRRRRDILQQSDELDT